MAFMQLVRIDSGDAVVASKAEWWCWDVSTERYSRIIRVR
jgi:hypothetical protein